VAALPKSEQEVGAHMHAAARHSRPTCQLSRRHKGVWLRHSGPMRCQPLSAQLLAYGLSRHRTPPSTLYGERSRLLPLGCLPLGPLILGLV
jgi:hypothetical protein